LEPYLKVEIGKLEAYLKDMDLRGESLFHRDISRAIAQHDGQRTGNNKQNQIV